MIRYFFAGIVGAVISAGATLAFHSRITPPPTQHSTASDSAAAYPGIVALHHADSVATVTQNLNQLYALWDSAAVRIAPGGPPTVGRAAIFKEDSTFFAQHPSRQMLKYAPHCATLSVSGDIAVEWGYFEAKVADAPGAKPDSGSGNALRVMRRQSNGEWKFSHLVLNSRRSAK